jgi:hypothetical protein
VSVSLQRGALAMLLGIGACVGVSAQTPPPAASPSSAQRATPAAASASEPAAKKQKRASRAKTPPGKPPRGTAECNQGDKAQRQRCLNDLYGPGGPRI